MRPLLKFVSAALVVGGGTASVAVATASTPRATPVASFSPATKIAPARYLHVLNAHRAIAASASGVAADFSGATRLVARYRPDFSAATTLSTPAPAVGRPAQLVPGNGAACLDVPDPSGPGFTLTCEATQVILQGRLMEIGYPADAPDLATVYGVAPDGITSVTGASASGQTVTVPVVGNAYKLTLNGLRSLEVGSNRVPIGAPLPAPTP